LASWGTPGNFNGFRALASKLHRRRSTVTGQLADTPARGLPTRGRDDSRTGQLADATGNFACLVFVLLAAYARPRVVQLPARFQRRSTKLCTMFGHLLRWYTICITFWGLLSPDVQNSLCVQVLRSPILAALLHGTRALAHCTTLFIGLTLGKRLQILGERQGGMRKSNICTRKPAISLK